MNCRWVFSTLALILFFLGSADAVNIRDVSYTTKNAGKVVFSHADHLNKKGMSKNCRACHDALFDLKNKKHFSMAEMEKGRSCGACHNSKQAFSVNECSKCHTVKELVFKEKSVGNVIFSHKFHSGLYTCFDCHTALFNTVRSKMKVTMKEMEKGKSCGGCHDGKTAFSVKDKCEACHKI